MTNRRKISYATGAASVSRRLRATFHTPSCLFLHNCVLRRNKLSIFTIYALLGFQLYEKIILIKIRLKTISLWRRENSITSVLLDGRKNNIYSVL